MKIEIHDKVQYALKSRNFQQQFFEVTKIKTYSLCYSFILLLLILFFCTEEVFYASTVFIAFLVTCLFLYLKKSEDSYFSIVSKIKTIDVTSLSIIVAYEKVTHEYEFSYFEQVFERDDFFIFHQQEHNKILLVPKKADEGISSIEKNFKVETFKEQNLKLFLKKRKRVPAIILVLLLLFIFGTTILDKYLSSSINSNISVQTSKSKDKGSEYILKTIESFFNSKNKNLLYNNFSKELQSKISKDELIEDFKNINYVLGEYDSGGAYYKERILNGFKNGELCSIYEYVCVFNFQKGVLVVNTQLKKTMNDFSFETFNISIIPNIGNQEKKNGKEPLIYSVKQPPNE